MKASAIIVSILIISSTLGGILVADIYSISTFNRRNSLVKEVLYNPVVVEAYRYKRIIPRETYFRYPVEKTVGEYSTSPCELVGTDYRFSGIQEELYCWVESTFIPATNSLAIANNSIIDIPKGDSYLIVLAPTLIVESLTGASSIDELKPPYSLYRWQLKRWSVVYPVKKDGFITFRRIGYGIRAPPDILHAYYVYYYRDYISREQGFLDKLGLSEFPLNYYALLSDLNSFIRENELYEYLKYTQLLVEWEIDDPSMASINPVIMTTRIPGDLIGDGVGDRVVYAPSHQYFPENTLFPIPLPIYSTSYYASTIDLSNPIETLVSNMVFITINPGVYQGSFNLVIRVRTLDGKVVAVLKYRFEISGELWKFIETNLAFNPGYPSTSIRDIVETNYGIEDYYEPPASGWDLSSDTPLISAGKKISATIYDLGGRWKKSDVSRIIMPNYVYMWAETDIPVSSASLYSSVSASVRIEGYGSYGEAIVGISYHYVTYYYGRQEVELFDINYQMLEKTRFEAESKAIVRGGGTLPYPSQLKLGLESQEGYKNIEKLAIPAPYIGTGFIGTGYRSTSASYYLERPTIFKPIHDCDTWIGVSECSPAGMVCCEKDPSGIERCHGNAYIPPSEPCSCPAPEELTTVIDLTESRSGNAYVEGPAVFYYASYIYFLFKDPNSPITLPSFDYNGTGKANFITYGALIILPTSSTKGYSHYSFYKDYIESELIIVCSCPTYTSYAEPVVTYTDMMCLQFYVCPAVIHTDCFFETLKTATHTFSTDDHSLSGSYPLTPVRLRGSMSYGFLPGQNVGYYSGVSNNITYLSVLPNYVETLPGSRIEYYVEALYRGEALAGETLNVYIKYEDTIVSNKSVVLDSDGKAIVSLNAPSLDVLREIIGNETLFELLYNSSSYQMYFQVEFIVPSKGLYETSILSVRLGTGVTGKIAVVDFKLDYGTTTELLFGAKVTKSWLDTGILDPTMEEVPASAVTMVDTSEEDIQSYLYREFGANTTITLYVVNASSNKVVEKTRIDGINYKVLLPPGVYILYLEIDVRLDSGEEYRFRTINKTVEVREDEPAEQDFYIPIPPILRILKILDDVEEWSILDADLAYLIENFMTVVQGPTEKIGPLVTLLTNTYQLLANYARTSCKFTERPLALVWFESKELPSICDYLLNFSIKLSELVEYIASGGKDPSVIRRYAVELATVKTRLGIISDIRRYVIAKYIESPLPPYDSWKFINLGSDPWNQLYRLSLGLAYISNMKSHVIRQLRIGVKFVALITSLMSIDYIISNKLFPVGNTLSSIFNKIGNALGGDKSLIVRTISRVFPTIQVTLNSLKIAAFTTTGMGLNLGLTNDKVKEWLVPEGYKGIDVGYAIANFFKFYRFSLSIIVNTAETDTVFEIVFHSVTQLVNYMLLSSITFTTNIIVRAYYSLIASGNSEDTIFDAMWVAYVGDASRNGWERSMEAIVSTLALSVNFLRGVGGLMDFVSGLKSIKAFKRLFGKTADNDVFMYLLETCGVDEALASVYKNNKLLGFMARVGKPMVKLGERVTWVVIVLVLVDILVTGISQSLTLYHIVYPKRTTFRGLVNDYNTIFKAFGKYSLFEAGDPLVRETYKPNKDLIDFINQIFPLRSSGVEYRGLGHYRVSGSSEGYSTVYYASTSSSYWDVTYSIEELVSEITSDIVDENYLNMSKLASLVYYNNILEDTLDKKYAETIFSSTSDNYMEVLNIIDNYRIVSEDFIRQAYVKGLSPQLSLSPIVDLANMTIELLSEIRELDPPQGLSGLPYVSVRLYSSDLDKYIVSIVNTGGVSGKVTVHVYSDQFIIEPSVVELDLSTTSSFEVTLTPVDENVSIGVLEVFVEKEDYGVIGYGNYTVGARDLYIPWSYNTSLGAIYSLKELTIETINSTSIKLVGTGNNLIVINSTTPVSVSVDGGGYYVRTVVVKDNYVTILWTVNTTDTTLSISSEIPQNTQTPFLPLEKPSTKNTPTLAPSTKKPSGLEDILNTPVGLGVIAAIAVATIVLIVFKLFRKT